MKEIWQKNDELWSGHIKLILFFALPISALIIILVLYAPNYLNYADPPIKADAVVLFVGPDLEAREKEANKLLDAGYADYLIIPVYGRISLRMSPLPVSITLDGPGQGVGDLKNYPSNMKNSGPVSNYPRFYENTHIEVLEAKRIMDQFGLKKANFVSSPIHLRRIKVMTDYVFHLKNSAPIAYQIKFVPALPESPGLKCRHGI